VNAVRTWLGDQGLGGGQAGILFAVLAGAAVVLLCFAANFIAKQIILRGVHAVIRRSKLTWDDVFLEHRVLVRLSHLAPALVIHATAPLAFGDYPPVVSTVKSLAVLYIVLVGLAVTDAFLNALLQIYEGFAVSRRVPLKGFVQVIKIIVFIMGGVFILSYFIGRSPIVFFSGLGAFTAVLILVFKDTILGLVAGIQLISNNMVRPGDWIEMPKYGVDGDVIDVTLTTIKVQNWDKTISTVPPYTLVTDSFKNWRGMSESGGRRIKRAVAIDMNSIAFCTQEMLDRFKKIRHIKAYLEKKLAEIDAHNRGIEVDETFLVNGRHLTNIGTFRAYLQAYLANHPKIHQDLTFLVRQLAPAPQGLPIEIYVFSRDQEWAAYEAIQADIFDHVLAVVPLFDLRVYQAPSGREVESLARAVAPG
jgi:miniconductance mechanosensitive channel